MKFKIGQKVVHPLHGVGEVQKIEEKVILGNTSRFSVIDFNTNRLQIMVNLDQKTMIRKIASKNELEKAYDIMKKKCGKLPSRSSDRFNFNMKKIKSSDLNQMAEVIRDLSDLNRRKKLSRKELTLLKSARKIFCNEICEVDQVTEEEAEARIDNIVKEAIPVAE